MAWSNHLKPYIGLISQTIGGTLLAVWGVASDHYVLLVLGLVATVGGIPITIYIERKRISDRERALTTYNDGLAVLMEAIRQLVISEDDDRAARTFFREVLSAGTQLLSRDGVRMSVYNVEGPDENQDSEDDVTDQAILRPKGRVFLLEHSEGRNDGPRYELVPSLASLAGDALDETAPRECDHDFGGGTACAVAFFPLVQDRSQFGILMIDSREQRRFTTDEKATGSLVSRMVTLGVELIRDRGHVVQAESQSVRHQLSLTRPRANSVGPAS